MSSLTAAEKLELAEKINQVMDDFFAEKHCMPETDALLLALHARTDTCHLRWVLGINDN